MEDKCTPRVIQQCEQTLQEAIEKGTSATPWSICLPWGGQLYQDATGIHAQSGTPPPDGIYDRIVVANGCIIDARKSEAPVYVGSPCAPLPGDCSGSGGGGSTGNTCNPSSTPGNLYRCDFSGRPLVTCEIVGGAGVTVTGSGTTADPYIISAGGGESGGVYLHSDNEAISITGAGTRDDPYVFAHKAGYQTTANGLVFDAYGHLVGETGGSANAGVQGIIGDEGIKVDVDNRSGIYTIGLEDPLNNKEGTYLFGGYNVTLDKYNRVFDIQQGINLGEPQTFTCGDKDITVNALGSITNVQPSSGGSAGASDMGGIVASVLWAGVRPWADNDRLEADFVLPADMQIFGMLFAPSPAAAVSIDNVDTNFLGSRFWTHPGWLGVGSHHIRILWPQDTDNTLSPAYISPTMLLIFNVPNPVTINMTDLNLPWR